MSCREYRGGLIEMVRGGRVAAGERQRLILHTGECVECARFLESQLSLMAEFDRIQSEEIPDSGEFAGAVMAEFDRARTAALAGRSKVLAWRWAAAVGLAAALVVGVVSLRNRTEWSQSPGPAVASQVAPVAHPPEAVPVVVPQPKLVQQAAAKPAANEESQQPFIAIPYTVPLAPEERTTVTRMDIPVSALVSAGFRVQVSDVSAIVRADVLVSQDGRARAIRPISISTQ